MQKNIFLINIKEKILVLLLVLFSLFINQHYGNKGIYPIDSFAHFDTGFRILIGEYPFKDYWIISGPFVDYVQAIFFYIFGVNWQSYVLHASIINILVAVTTFFVLKNFKLNIYLCFIYSLSLSILAYPSSGTPFVDHHSAFFSLFGIYALILGIKSENKIYWILLPIFLGFAFFSKQVPSSYIIICVIFILLLYMLVNKKFYWVKYSLLSTVFFIIFVFIFGSVQGIGFSSFWNQYILYPQTLGEERYAELNIGFKNIIFDFKYIYLSVAILFYTNIKQIFLVRNYFKNNDFYYFLIIIFLMISLIFHQILTMNQNFIFFLIPILIAFSHISVIQQTKGKNILITLMILLCLFSTIKYHFRFNENRKFHELNYVNFDLSSSGKEIDKKFSGLIWITPEYKNNSKEEIISILNIKNYLEKDNRQKMLLTNYSFFSVLLNQKLFSPIRWFIENGVAHPLKDNEYFQQYQNFLIEKIKENKIKVIYTIKPANIFFLKQALGKKCIKTSNVSNVLDAHSVLNCAKLE